MILNHYKSQWITIKSYWVTQKSYWITIKSYGITIKSYWITIKSYWITIKSHWIPEIHPIKSWFLPCLETHLQGLHGLQLGATEEILASSVDHPFFMDWTKTGLQKPCGCVWINIHYTWWTYSPAIFTMKYYCIYGCVWKCCVPLNPMVLLIIIPLLNG